MYSTSDKYSAARLPADATPAIQTPNHSCIINSCADLSKKLLAEGCKHTQFVLQLELLLDLALPKTKKKQKNIYRFNNAAGRRCCHGSR